MKRQNKDKLILKTLIDKMFEIAGHPLTFEDVEGRKDNWFQQYTMTKEQNKQWKEWAIPYLMKMRRYKKKTAEVGIAWIDLYCGLTINN
jgi:hypothetical protein